MSWQCKNSAGFSATELIIVILVIGALFGVGGYVWSSNAKTRQTSTKTSATKTEPVQQQPQITALDPYGDWKTYANNELGFKFRYPQDWGTVSVTRKALNNEKYETNLPYLVKFSNSEAPQARIFPADWKFNPPFATEWNSPLTREGLQKYQVSIVNDQAKIVAISYSSFDGQVSLDGLRSLTLTKLKATQVELHRDDPYDAKRQCLAEKKNEAGSMENVATLECYPETYRDNAVKFLNSFTVI